MIHHVVSWTLHEQDPAKKAEASAFIVGQLMSLPALIPEIITLNVASNAVAIDGNWDLVLIGDYADEDALRTYITHPEHQKVVAVIKPYFASRSAVDIIV
ncbi:MAG: stress responsive alpha-beta barrel protein [Microbacteriaceae bacterium]|jgi:hypothetical protein|nr:stress responsive alpha-beta barrel protein [Microbacteriaceae bacterium]